MHSHTTNPSLLGKQALCEKLSLSPRSVDRLVECGDLPSPLKISTRRIAWRADQIEAWVDSRPVAVVSEGGVK